MKKKILAVALVALLLTTCLLPCTTAFAVEENPNSPGLDEKFNFPTLDDACPESVFLGWYDSSEQDGVYQAYLPANFEYLEQVPNTPFAELKTATFYFPCLAISHIDTPDSLFFYNHLPLETFFEYLNVVNFGVLQSYIKSIVTVESDLSDGLYTFRAVYYDTFYLCAKNSDGGFKNYYLNCNQTLKEYISEDLGTSLLPQNVYDIFRNDIYLKYGQELGTRNIDNLYGYWSFVAIPQGNVFNEFFQAVGSGTFLSPSVSYFQYIIHVSYNNKGELDTEFGSTKFASFLSNLSTYLFTGKKPTASCFLIYMDGGDSTVFITQNGSTDLDNNLGAGTNGAVDGIEDALDSWGESFKQNLALIAIAGLFLIVFAIILRRRKKR